MTNKRLLIAIGLLVVLVLLTLLFRSGRQSFNWRETYKYKSKDPYGTHIMHELLKTYLPGEKVTVLEDSISAGLSVEPSKPANYIFIGEGAFMSTFDVDTLLHFVDNGNLAFISSRTIPFDLMFHLYYEECDNYPWDDYLAYPDTTVSLTLTHPDLEGSTDYPFKYITRYRTAEYRWQYIESPYFCDQEEGFLALGHMNDSLVNFARIQYGGGYFYLHTTPLAFTNMQLLDKTGLEYAGKVFSHLHEGPIYWDEYSKVPEWLGRRQNEAWRGNARRLMAESPLQYILSEPPLTWAWYLLLALGLLYLFYQAKRRQRIIPVLEQNTNTSLEFIATIGRLFFIQNSHKQLALEQMKLFQAYTRNHYNLQRREMDEEFVNRLSAKSEIPVEDINKIVNLYANIEKSSYISNNTLVDFHKLLDEFYKTCK